MKNKNVECKICGTRNWSGEIYCEKCSGALYHNHNQEKAAAKLKSSDYLLALWDQAASNISIENLKTLILKALNIKSVNMKTEYILKTI